MDSLAPHAGAELLKSLVVDRVGDAGAPGRDVVAQVIMDGIEQGKLASNCKLAADDRVGPCPYYSANGQYEARESWTWGQVVKHAVPGGAIDFDIIKHEGVEGLPTRLEHVQAVTVSIMKDVAFGLEFEGGDQCKKASSKNFFPVKRIGIGQHMFEAVDSFVPDEDAYLLPFITVGMVTVFEFVAEEHETAWRTHRRGKSIHPVVSRITTICVLSHPTHSIGKVRQTPTVLSFVHSADTGHGTPTTFLLVAGYKRDNPEKRQAGGSRRAAVNVFGRAIRRR